MFYRPEDGHGLPHDPFKAVVTPRPIGWISTRDSKRHDNLAPYSFFNAVASSPPQVAFGSNGSKPDRTRGKDSSEIALDTGCFCVNIVELAMKDRMNLTSGPYGAGMNEFDIAELERIECRTIDCFRVAEAPASLECRLVAGIDLLGEENRLIIGEVTGVHMRDDCLVDGRFDITRFRPLARLGYRDYSWIEDTFSMMRPSETTLNV